MSALRKYLGIVWMIISPLAVFLLINSAISNIDAQGKSDINKPIPWLIIIAIFTPIAVGLFVFGLYAVRGEYDSLPDEKKSD